MLARCVVAALAAGATNAWVFRPQGRHVVVPRREVMCRASTKAAVVKWLTTRLELTDAEVSAVVDRNPRVVARSVEALDVLVTFLEGRFDLSAPTIGQKIVLGRPQVLSFDAARAERDPTLEHLERQIYGWIQ